MIALPALAAPGDLDPKFSNDGKLTTNFTSQSEEAHGAAIQTDGKIVVAGFAYFVVGGDKLEGRFALARYKPNGALDSTFSDDGKLTTNFASGGASALGGVAIQTDGKIVAAGVARGKDDRFAVARYKPSGALDTTFSDDGKLTTNFASGWAETLAIQTDGRIVVAGTAREGGRFAVARYKRNGTLDTTFSGNGKLTTNFTSVNDWAEDVTIQTDGRIVVAGTAREGGRFAVARYNRDGTLDTTFSGNGKLTTDFSAERDEGYGVVVQGDGKIVAAGRTGGYYSQFALARYNPDGTLDTTFDGDGKLTTDFDVSDEEVSAVAHAVTIQDDGKIVAAGAKLGPGDYGSFALARYNPDGTLDTTFGDEGLRAVSFDIWGRALAVAIQGDGKIVTAGYAGDEEHDRFAVARFLAD